MSVEIAKSNIKKMIQLTFVELIRVSEQIDDPRTPDHEARMLLEQLTRLKDELNKYEYTLEMIELEKKYDG